MSECSLSRMFQTLKTRGYWLAQAVMIRSRLLLAAIRDW